MTAGRTVQSMTHRMLAMLLIWSNLRFHSFHLDPPDFFRPSSSDVAAEERTPILTLGLLFGERPIDGRFARLTVPIIFGRTDEESERKENAKRQWEGIPRPRGIYVSDLFNIPKAIRGKAEEAR